MDTKFKTQLQPKWQILLPKSVDYLLAEVTEIISDTEVRIKKEFGGESGKGTTRLREKLGELKQEGLPGIEYKTMPFVDQQEMYRFVYQRLKEGGCIGIFPEGTFVLSESSFTPAYFACRRQSRPNGPPSTQGRCCDYGFGRNGE